MRTGTSAQSCHHSISILHSLFRDARATTLATFFADSRVKLRTLLALGRFAAFLANLGVKLRAALLFHGLATLLANPGIELGAIFFPYRLTSTFGFLRSWLWSTFVIRHRKSRPSVTSYNHLNPTSIKR